MKLTKKTQLFLALNSKRKDKEPTISNDWIGYVSENGIQPILDCETNEFL